MGYFDNTDDTKWPDETEQYWRVAIERNIFNANSHSEKVVILKEELARIEGQD